MLELSSFTFSFTFSFILLTFSSLHPFPLNQIRFDYFIRMSGEGKSLQGLIFLSEVYQTVLLFIGYMNEQNEEKSKRIILFPDLLFI